MVELNKTERISNGLKEDPVEIRVAVPGRGQTENIVLEQGQRVNLGFAGKSVTPVIDDKNLVLVFGDSTAANPDSRIVFRNLLEQATGEQDPVFIVDGIEIFASSLIAAIEGLDDHNSLAVAAGEVLQNSGGSLYSDDFNGSKFSTLGTARADMVAVKAVGEVERLVVEVRDVVNNDRKLALHILYEAVDQIEIIEKNAVFVDIEPAGRLVIAAAVDVAKASLDEGGLSGIAVAIIIEVAHIVEKNSALVRIAEDAVEAIEFLYTV